MQQAEESMQGRGGEHTHPVTPSRPGSTAQKGRLQEKSEWQALDLGKTATDSSNMKAVMPSSQDLAIK